MIFTGGFIGEPPVEIHDFYRRFCLENRVWKLIFTDIFLVGQANFFPQALFN